MNVDVKIAMRRKTSGDFVGDQPERFQNPLSAFTVLCAHEKRITQFIRSAFIGLSDLPDSFINDEAAFD